MEFDKILCPAVFPKYIVLIMTSYCANRSCLQTKGIGNYCLSNPFHTIIFIVDTI